MASQAQYGASSGSGNVDQRDTSSEEGTRAAQRRRRLREHEDYDNPLVLSFAARNQQGRFYIPTTNNSFGDMIDSGCSTLLLPFPLAGGLPLFLGPTYYFGTNEPKKNKKNTTPSMHFMNAAGLL